MNDTSVLLPLMPLARHLDVPEYMLRDLPPAGRAVSTDEPLFDPVAAKVYLRRHGVLFVGCKGSTYHHNNGGDGPSQPQ